MILAIVTLSPAACEPFTTIARHYTRFSIIAASYLAWDISFNVLEIPGARNIAIVSIILAVFETILSEPSTHFKGLQDIPPDIAC